MVADGSGTTLLTANAAAWQGTWLWILLLGGLGVGAGYAKVRLGRRPAGPGRLLGLPEGALSPVRIAPQHVEATLHGPLSTHRVVLLGPPEWASDRVFPCVEKGPLPLELVRAVEDLATRPGPPVALLVSSADLLDPAGADSTLEDLEHAVAGRFPLWVVDGPAEWEAWVPQNQGETGGSEEGSGPPGADGSPWMGGEGGA